MPNPAGWGDYESTYTPGCARCEAHLAVINRGAIVAESIATQLSSSNMTAMGGTVQGSVQSGAFSRFIPASVHASEVLTRQTQTLESQKAEISASLAHLRSACTASSQSQRESIRRTIEVFNNSIRTLSRELENLLARSSTVSTGGRGSYQWTVMGRHLILSGRQEANWVGNSNCFELSLTANRWRIFSCLWWALFWYSWGSHSAGCCYSSSTVGGSFSWCFAEQRWWLR